ncbi:hypothetical protein [Marimonas arenosa]|uniref:RNase NYN domain-containing protein n=1 Tax=Marimonas arenosa TaxID=1795305 RepID=A0AAE4B7H3_9RHOB|nr:hypothetical protein [Marimonas arenosa]MDQ2092329.1 hypothetical protein [Marimonas arenosa]
MHMSSNNPLEPLETRRTRVAKLADQVRSLQGAQENLQKTIESFKAFEPDVQKGTIERLEQSAADLSRKISDQKVNHANLERRLQIALDAKANPIVFWKFFKAEQKQLRAEAKRLADKVSKVEQELSSNENALQKARSDIRHAQRRISEHETFDLKDAETRLGSVQTQLQSTGSDLAEARSELKEIEAKISPHTQKLDSLKSELRELNADIARADRFDQKLASAANSYERAMIHQDCEAEFGTGSPKQVIKDRRGKIRRLENNIPKLERRLRDELRKLDRKITHLLIDGNNACYEGQTFIELRGISALLKGLGDRFEVTVVFDASIRAMLKMDNQGVEQILGPSVTTHIVPTKDQADEYLMKLAGTNKGAFILSNDRFGEYHDYDVVKSNRVLRFLIANGKFIVNDLDVTVSI